MNADAGPLLVVVRHAETRLVAIGVGIGAIEDQIRATAASVSASRAPASAPCHGPTV